MTPVSTTKPTSPTPRRTNMHSPNGTMEILMKCMLTVERPSKIRGGRFFLILAVSIVAGCSSSRGSHPEGLDPDGASVDASVPDGGV
jgi:hypothetical protein